MKKTLFSAVSVFTALVMIFSLAGCGQNDGDKENTAVTVTVTDIYKKISESVTLPAEIAEYYSDYLVDEYGIDVDTIEECRVILGSYTDEIVIIKAKNEDSVKEIAEILNEHIEDQKKVMSNYDPKQCKVLESSMVCSNGLYVAMFISADQDKMADIFNSFFK